jgi:DNA-binding transcriptional LysR family regulator
MNKFQAITVFVRVAESGGFTAAASKLGMSISAVTKAIARLEDELGTQLFTRTTRQLRTTEFGQDFYERCVRILSDLEDAEIAVQRDNQALKGRVRAVLPFSFGRVTVVPELPVFCARHPDIMLDLNFSDGPVDIIGEGYDVAVRTGEIDDSRLTTRLLMKSVQVTVAAPSYLEKYGVPQTPEDLKNHNCIVGRFGSEWAFKRPEDGSRFSVRVQGNTVINSGDALREAAVAGLGIIQGTWFLARKDLERGAVQSILTDYALEGTPIALLYPANRHLPRKTRAFLDFLIEITRTA